MCVYTYIHIWETRKYKYICFLIVFVWSRKIDMVKGKVSLCTLYTGWTNRSNPKIHAQGMFTRQYFLIKTENVLCTLAVHLYNNVQAFENNNVVVQTTKMWIWENGDIMIITCSVNINVFPYKVTSPPTGLAGIIQCFYTCSQIPVNSNRFDFVSETFKKSKEKTFQFLVHCNCVNIPSVYSLILHSCVGIRSTHSLWNESVQGVRALINVALITGTKG